MELPVAVPGFEQHKVMLHSAGLTAAYISLDGKKVPRAKGLFELQAGTGAKAQIRLKGMALDPLPNLEVNGQFVQMRPNLTPLQWVFVVAPLVLIALGGALGGGLGGVAAYGSAFLFRSKLSPVVQYIAAAALTGAVVIVWLVIVALIYSVRT